MRDTEVIIPCRLSYAFIAAPRKNEDGSDGKYSAACVIDKSDTATLEKIGKAVEAAKEKGKSKLANEKGVIPKSIKLPLRDGDDTDKDEYQDSYFINVSNAEPVPVFDGRCKRIPADEISQEIYSGVYANVKVNFYAFKFSGNRGIAAGLQGLQKWKDGEHLGGGGATADDFEVLEETDEADEAEDFDFCD